MGSEEGGASSFGAQRNYYQNTDSIGDSYVVSLPATSAVTLTARY